MTRPRGSVGAGVLLPVLVALLGGCTSSVEGTATAAPPAPGPATPAELEELVVDAVPSGLPRIPDAELDPPAGEKSAEDLAAYADDPAREREVLHDYGYRHGWERFWGTGPQQLTSVFVDQFESRAGAGAYAADLAGNDAEHYDGVLRESPPHLPGGCALLTVEQPPPGTDLAGPAAFAWCAHGVFSVGVSAVAGTLEAATAEVAAVVDAQLALLPPG
ncbi:DUF7373 family lipoprotein [Geodermatophilus marinus]|uniref:DUF7373 family lipoprotein n=1 Tax=Geodermatophilus sp. LHW52908 TaxID=2303986 RepID=UPI000E3DE65D|nr:hypothetical protein [Geodermatophilus sp. LHW52908]RFU19476.1 hypothetical protein D0Z06_21010 [Geodermatophilus sp. LHW52908]